MATDSSPKSACVAFVSTRIAGTDGVSLEIEKWANVIEKMGHECHYIAGELDRPADRSVLIEEAHFSHPEIQEINRVAFSCERRPPGLTDKMMGLTRSIRDQLAGAIDTLKIDAIIAENCLTIPMNLRHLSHRHRTDRDSPDSVRRLSDGPNDR